MKLSFSPNDVKGIPCPHCAGHDWIPLYPVSVITRAPLSMKDLLKTESVIRFQCFWCDFVIDQDAIFNKGGKLSSQNT